MDIGVKLCPKQQEVDKDECMTAFHSIKDEYNLVFPNADFLKVGSWIRLPAGCSKMIKGPVHWNEYSNPRGDRVEGGEFRIICRAGTMKVCILTYLNPGVLDM